MVLMRKIVSFQAFAGNATLLSKGRSRAVMLKFDRFYLISPEEMHAIVSNVHRRAAISPSVDGSVHHATSGGVIDSSWEGSRRCIE
jgi:hypothetical protein